MQNTFLTAQWRKLIMANYPVEPGLLRSYLPPRTELDVWEGETYVSLVGFIFRDVKVLGWSIPFHTRFPEVNLRFYVRFKEGNTWKRGVVFISEVVPKPAITWIANNLFKEHYSCLPMQHYEKREGASLHTGYRWKYKGNWNRLEVQTDPEPGALQQGSSEAFITEHFWGYSIGARNETVEYQVEHPSWDIYTVRDHTIECDFGELYGSEFAGLATRSPESVFLAEGSPVKVGNKRIV